MCKQIIITIEGWTEEEIDGAHDLIRSIVDILAGFWGGNVLTQCAEAPDVEEK